jgi:branched-chain amino acid transport system ATP-binding protein
MSAAADKGQTPLLKVTGLGAGYGGMPVLRDVSLAVFPAEIVALVGSNGAGKTTLLRALSRVIACTGNVEFDGRTIVPMTPDEAFGAGLVQVP